MAMVPFAGYYQSPERPPDYLLKWGGPGSGDGQFNWPLGVAVDATGNVYVADGNNFRIQKFSSAGVFLAQWGSFGSGDGQFSNPTDVAIDATGNVYVADGYNQITIDQAFDDADDTGIVDVPGGNNHRIQKFSSAGAFLGKWGSQGGGGGLLDNPTGVAVDAAGNVYVADTTNFRIQKFSSAGVFLAQWGSSGGGDGQLEN